MIYNKGYLSTYLGKSIVMRSFLKNLGSAIQKICYPSICLYCHKICENKRYIFCAECFYLIDILEQEERCRTCFSPSTESYCLSCRHQSNIKQAYVCEQEGPVPALLKSILNHQHYRVPAVAALIAYQYIRLDFPLPDYIVPIYSTHKKLSILLAKEVGKILQAPCKQFFLEKLQNKHVLATGFQLDQNYDQTMQVLKKRNPKILMGITLIGPSSF